MYPSYGLPHVNPQMRITLDAGGSDMEELQHVADNVGFGGDFGVEKLPLPVLVIVGRQHPLDDVNTSLAAGEVLGRELSGEDLEDDDAEAVDVGLLRDALVLDVVWGLVGEHGLGGVGLAHQRLEGVVAEDRLVVLRQQDVAGLEIAVGEVV